MSNPETTIRHIEDDLSAPPVKLRAELRRLRSFIAPEYQAMAAREIEATEWRHDRMCAVLQRILCPLTGSFFHPEGSSYACACPGTCRAYAEQIIRTLNDGGYQVVPIENSDPDRAIHDGTGEL